MNTRLDVYLSDYEDVFKNKTKSNFQKAELYVKGLALSGMKNIERISESLDTAYHQMQHFITDAKWNHREVIDKVAREISSSLPKSKLTGLIIDESGWVKKGDKSVGTGHQYCGNVGKVANSQVAVFGCLNNGKYAGLADARLYLPKTWTDNPKRCSLAGIPEQDTTFKTKPELALEIIQHQHQMGIAFDYVSADGLYGNDASLAQGVDDLGLIYMFDIHSNQTIYLKKPELYIPERRSAKGRAPKKLKASVQSIKVNQYAKTLKAKDWQSITVRDTAKGALKGQYHFKDVYIWDKNEDTVRKRMLLIRRNKTKSGKYELRYAFTNANLVQYTEKGLAYMQAQRFFVEHSFREAKQVLGLDQFQTRKWKSWHHQVALNFMVGSFMLKEKILHQNKVPLLSARDIMDFMVFKFYKEITEDIMLARLRERHRKRKVDIGYCYSKKN